MARYDKYDPISGGFRARLAANIPETFAAVSLNAAGRVVIGTAGQSGLVGVLVKNAARVPMTATDVSTYGVGTNPNAPIALTAGSVVDIMTQGDIVELDPEDFPAGSKVYAAADGTISTTNAGTDPVVGWTVEAGRLVVRVAA